MKIEDIIVVGVALFAIVWWVVMAIVEHIEEKKGESKENEE